MLEGFFDRDGREEGAEESVGGDEGESDGMLLFEGWCDGDKLGIFEGISDRSLDGTEEGIIEVEGFEDGFDVGLDDGSCEVEGTKLSDGRKEGDFVGDLDGCKEVLCVGTVEVSSDGLVECALVGMTDGSNEGLELTSSEGRIVGVEDGLDEFVEGNRDGLLVGDSVSKRAGTKSKHTSHAFGQPDEIYLPLNVLLQ